jgi:hypothetical protein
MLSSHDAITATLSCHHARNHVWRPAKRAEADARVWRVCMTRVTPSPTRSHMLHAHTCQHPPLPPPPPPTQAMAAKLSVQKALGGMEGLADEQVISTVRHAARDVPAQHRVAACRRTLARVTLGHS